MFEIVQIWEVRIQNFRNLFSNSIYAIAIEVEKGCDSIKNYSGA